MLVFLFASSSTAYSCEQEQSYTIGVQNIDYNPHYDFVTPNKNSFFYLFVEWLKIKTACQFKVIPLPIKRLELAFSQQQLDFIYPDNPNWHTYKESTKNPASRRIYSPKIVTGIGATIVLKKQAELAVNDFKILAVPRGFTPTHWLSTKAGQTIKYREVSDATAALKMVQSARASGADVEYNVAQYLIKKHQLPAMTMGEKLPAIQIPFHIATIKNKKLMATITQLINQYPDDIEALKQQAQVSELTMVNSSN